MNGNIFNGSGAVSDLRSRLHVKSIDRFNSIPDILDFQKNYQQEIADFLEQKKIEINEDILSLTADKKRLVREYSERKIERKKQIAEKIDELKTLINNPQKSPILCIKRFFARRKLNRLESNIDNVLEKPFKGIIGKIQNIEGRASYLQNHRAEELDHRAQDFINNIRFIKAELDNLSSLIFGGIGELKAIELFKQLPDQFYIINDFRKTFQPPIFNSQENDRIYSIQIDHVIIGPTGLYVIETKFWSYRSINSEALYSPIKQLKRSGFAFFVLLNNFLKKMPGHFLGNWGQIKVSVFNILLMMNASTNEQFQFVKILTGANVLGYLTRRPVIFNKEQIKHLAEVINDLNET